MTLSQFTVSNESPGLAERYRMGPDEGEHHSSSWLRRWRRHPTDCGFAGWYCSQRNEVNASINLRWLFPFVPAYIDHGGYNVFLVDWGALGQPPCYVAAVYNIRPIASCLAQTFMKLRTLGLPAEKTTCVGHSLGAHICGLMANHLNFRLERIIGNWNTFSYCR